MLIVGRHLKISVLLVVEESRPKLLRLFDRESFPVEELECEHAQGLAPPARHGRSEELVARAPLTDAPLGGQARIEGSDLFEQSPVRV